MVELCSSCVVAVYWFSVVVVYMCVRCACVACECVDAIKGSVYVLYVCVEVRVGFGQNDENVFMWVSIFVVWFCVLVFRRCSSSW